MAPVSQRVKPLGHRRLFRCFDVIEAGAALGVGTVAAWILCSFDIDTPLSRHLLARKRQVVQETAVDPLPRRIQRAALGKRKLRVLAECGVYLNQYGAAAGVGAPPRGTIPEPASLTLLAALARLGAARRRNGTK